MTRRTVAQAELPKNRELHGLRDFDGVGVLPIHRGDAELMEYDK
jgi:hypothetical protein